MKVFVERLPLGVEENEREEPDPPLLLLPQFFSDRIQEGFIVSATSKRL